MRRATMLAFALWLPLIAHAEDSLVDKAEKAEKAQKTLGNKVDEITTAASERKELAVEAAGEASDRAKEVVDEAKGTAAEVKESLEERMAETKELAKAYASTLKDQLGERVKELGDSALTMVADSKTKMRDWMQGARDEARKALIGAASALDNKTRDARNKARKEHWDKFRKRYRLEDQAPTMEVSEELRDHEYRLARLRRARELADSREDAASVARSDRLMEMEYARHRARLLRLIERDRKAQSQLKGEEPEP